MMAEMRPKPDTLRTVFIQGFRILSIGANMIVPILIVAGLRAAPVPAFDAELELEKAIHREIVLGDPLGAIDQYLSLIHI